MPITWFLKTVVFENNIAIGEDSPKGIIHNKHENSGLKILRNWIKDTIHNGIALHGSVYDLEIAENLFTDIGRTAKFSGEGGYENTSITGNEFLRVQNAGINVAGGGQAGLTIENNSFKDTGLEFFGDPDNADRAAVRLYSDQPYENAAIVGNSISDSRTGIAVRTGDLVWTDVVISNNGIVGNEMGFLNLTDTDVDARNKWWGHNSGPFHETGNPGGQGDTVSDNVLFDPWITGPDPRPDPDPVPAPDPSLPPDVGTPGFDGFNANLSWSDSPTPGITNFNVYGSTGGEGLALGDVSGGAVEGFKWTLIAQVPPDTTQYTHTGLTPGVRYYYVITSHC